MLDTTKMVKAFIEGHEKCNVIHTRIAMKVVDEGGRRGFLVHCRKKAE